MATVTISGETVEAGGTILLPKNYHAVNYTEYLNLKRVGASWDSFGIWDGKKFVLKTVEKRWKVGIVERMMSVVNKIYLLGRYGFSGLKVQTFVEDALGRFLKYYQDPEERPVFESVEEMLKWTGLYDLTSTTLEDLMIRAKLSPSLMLQLAPAMTRYNYAQTTKINGLAGVVSLAAMTGGLWAVEGGNWQMAAGLINRSDVELHLHEQIGSISHLGNYYELNSNKGVSYTCEVVVVATPLDELDIHFSPSISIPQRKLQHLDVTFVRGILNPVYFGMEDASKVPDLMGTMEDPDIPFISIQVLSQHSENDFTYKIFSDKPMAEALLDDMFRLRKETVRVSWSAYPHYSAPEVFAPFILDGQHMYYVNTFENAASAIEMSAVAAENVARLILSRFFGESNQKSSPSAGKGSRMEL